MMAQCCPHRLSQLAAGGAGQLEELCDDNLRIKKIGMSQNQGATCLYVHNRGPLSVWSQGVELTII